VNNTTPQGGVCVDLSFDQLEKYKKDGYIFISSCFSSQEVKRMKEELPRLFNKESPSRIVEKNGHTVRSLYGCHKTSAVFKRMVSSAKLLRPAQQLVDRSLYVYQFKVNAKMAFQGDVWQWHQDYIFWLEEDGLAEPNVTNAVVFLDEVTEFNGPLLLIPGSHKEGVIDPGKSRDNDMAHDSKTYRQSPSWISNLTADLKYSLGQKTVASLIDRYGVVAPKGEAGSVLFFHPNVVHGSSTNISPFDRMLILVTYNSTANIPHLSASRRPEFLVSSDYEPLQVLSDDALLSQ
jgi:ectoine hydroxylase-related dioxygenase (phytanoyl-CoA dioxygenase family)